MSLTRSKNGFSASSPSPSSFSCGSVARELFEQPLLILRELLRDRDARDDVKVSVAAPVHVRHALAAQLEARAGLRAGGDVDVLAAVERRHLHAAAERERREADRHLAVEVVLLAMEERVLLHVDDDVEIAGRAAGRTVFAFAVQAEPLSRRDPGGNLHRQLALAADTSGAAARLARLGDRLAGAAARRARPRDGEEALLIAQLTRALALAARLGRRACRRARALCTSRRFPRAESGSTSRRPWPIPRTRSPGRSADRRRAAVRRAGGAGRRCPRGRTRRRGRRRCRRSPRRSSGRIRRRPRRADAGVSEPVVQTLLLLIREDRVRFGRFLERFLGLVIAGIAIGMELQRQLAVRALDLLLRRVALDAEDLVVVPLGHAAHPLATFTIDGRSSRSPSMYPRRNSSMISPSRRPSAGSCATAW